MKEGHCHEQLMQTMIVRLLKTQFFTLILDFEKSTEYNCVSDQTCLPPGRSVREGTGNAGKPEKDLRRERSLLQIRTIDDATGQAT